MIRIPQAELVPTDVRLELQKAYIELLLQHEPLRRELDALYEEREKYPFLKPPSPEETLEDSTAAIAHWMLQEYFAFLVNECLPEESEAILLERPSIEWHLYQFYKQMYAFCRKWKLPYELWEGMFYQVFSVSDCEEVRWWRENQPLPVGVGFTHPTDLPEPPHLPEYNPLTETRESYLARVQQMVDAYCEQVEAGWRGAGWRGGQAFSHYRNPQYLQRLAKQAFMRVVLGMGWGAIRNALDADGMFIEARSTIKRSTERAIELLQITERYESVFCLPLHQQIWAKQREISVWFGVSDAS